MQGTKNLTEGPIKKQLFTWRFPSWEPRLYKWPTVSPIWPGVGRLGSEAVACYRTVGILTWMTTSISYLNKVGSEVSVAQRHRSP